MAVDWSRYNLPAIWMMLKDENVCDGADRVLSWDTLSQDVDDQHKRLVAAQEKLAEVWSPDKNASAQVFLQQVGVLAGSMGETLKAAQETRAGLQGIMDAIVTAQSTLSPLVSARKAASGDLIPRFVDDAEDDFDRAGQQAMRVAEAAIQDHGSQINPPTLFFMRSGTGDSTKDLPVSGEETPSTTGATRASIVAMPKAVPVPHEPPDFGSRPSSETETSDDASSAGAVVSGATGDGGPALAGVLPLAPSTPAGPGASLPGTGVALPVGGVIGGGLPGGSLPGAVFGGGALGFGAAGGAGNLIGGLGGPGLAPGTGSAGLRERPPIRRGLPSGATIGADEAEGGLGGRGASSQRSRAGESAGGGPIGGQTVGRGRRDVPAQGETFGGGPDLFWGVRQGVAPVIEPDTTPVRHDPGPGVIGFRG